ncbi:MAG: hypothetical protein IJG53_06770, partial [Eggerthellaceae bacterium]|nr:hypothetical protein [Eggerthellaceae bacterium]
RIAAEHIEKNRRILGLMPSQKKPVRFQLNCSAHALTLTGADPFLSLLAIRPSQLDFVCTTRD